MLFCSYSLVSNFLQCFTFALHLHFAAKKQILKDDFYLERQKVYQGISDVIFLFLSCPLWTYHCWEWRRQSGDSSHSRFQPSWSHRCPLGCTSPGQNRRFQDGGLPADMMSGYQHHPPPEWGHKKTKRIKKILVDLLEKERVKIHPTYSQYTLIRNFCCIFSLRLF